MSESARHRVVVVGGGFGGIQAVKKLAYADVDVTLVDRNNYHLFQPLNYQVATGSLSSSEIAVPLRSIFRHARNVRVVLGSVSGFDLEGREVAIEPVVPGAHPCTLPYDTLLVSGGSSYNYFGHEDWRSLALEVKSLDSALQVRGRIFQAFEAAELATDPNAQEEWMTFVIVGAGPTGVEMSGQIAELARDTLPSEFRRIDTSAGRVLLVETADRVLSAFPPSLSVKAKSSLEKLGVTVMLSHTVVGVHHDCVEVQAQDGTKTEIPARTVVWAAGVKASTIAQKLGEATGADVDKAGRVTVEPDLSMPGHPEVIAFGDMVRRPRRAQRRGPHPSRARTGRDAAGALCGPPRPRPSRAALNAAVPLPRQGHAGDDRPSPGSRGRPRNPLERVPGVGRVADDSSLLPDRLREPAAGDRAMGVQLLHPRARSTADHPGGADPDREGLVTGPLASQAQCAASTVSERREVIGARRPFGGHDIRAELLGRRRACDHRRHRGL